jgi:hypothetical protein
MVPAKLDVGGAIRPTSTSGAEPVVQTNFEPEQQVPRGPQQILGVLFPGCKSSNQTVTIESNLSNQIEPSWFPRLALNRVFWVVMRRWSFWMQIKL